MPIRDEGLLTRWVQGTMEAAEWLSLLMDADSCIQREDDFKFTNLFSCCRCTPCLVLVVHYGSARYSGSSIKIARCW